MNDVPVRRLCRCFVFVTAKLFTSFIAQHRVYLQLALYRAPIERERVAESERDNLFVTALN